MQELAGCLTQIGVLAMSVAGLDFHLRIPDFHLSYGPVSKNHDSHVPAGYRIIGHRNFPAFPAVVLALSLLINWWFKVLRGIYLLAHHVEGGPAWEQRKSRGACSESWEAGRGLVGLPSLPLRRTGCLRINRGASRQPG